MPDTRPYSKRYAISSGADERAKRYREARVAEAGWEVLMARYRAEEKRRRARESDRRRA